MKKMFRCGLLLLLPAWCDASLHAATADDMICEREMIAASAEEGVPLGILYAVAMTETGRKSMLQPYALNIEGRTIFTSTKQEALSEFARARHDGKKLIDLGCMQINHYYHGSEFASVEAMLDPETNVRYAAKFLRRLRLKEGSWAMAVARYHAGPNNDPAQKRYICAVLHNLVLTGFGSWTAGARKFCS